MSQPVDVDRHDSLIPNQRLDDRYCIHKKLGEGGMGQVYLATDERMQREVAIKLLRPGLNDAGAKILRNEAQITAALDHPGIVKVYDIAQLPSEPAVPEHLRGMYYMVLEYVSGTTLFCQLRDRCSSRSPEQTLRLFRELVAGVAFAHERKVIHRDLKPGNIIVQRHGLKILDFGIAQASERIRALPDAPLMCSPCGTPWYMRPVAQAALEQNQRIAPDTRDDVYALGVILYQMLASELCHPLEQSGQGHRTYLQVPDRVQFADPYLRNACDALIIAALGLDPTRQIIDAQVLLNACDALLAGWYAYLHEQTRLAAHTHQEQLLVAQRHAYMEQRNELLSKHRRARRGWLVGTTVGSGLLFWSIVGSFMAYERHRDAQQLLTSCETMERAAATAQRIDPHQVAPALQQINHQLVRGRSVPRSCIEALYRSHLVSRGLRHDSALAMQALWPDAQDWLRGELKDVRAVAIAADVGTVAGGSADGQMRVGRRYAEGLRAVADAPTRLPPTPIPTPIGAFALSADAHWLAAAYDGGRAVFQFDLQSGSAPVVFRVPGHQISSVELTSAAALTLGTRAGEVWSSHRASPEKSLRLVLSGIQAPVRHTLQLDPALMLVVTDHHVGLWSLVPPKRLAFLAMSVVAVLPHRQGAPELLVKSSRGLHLWRADAHALSQLAQDTQRECSLTALLDGPAARRGLSQSAAAAPGDSGPTEDDPRSCLAVICHQIDRESGPHIRLEPICHQLETKASLPFLDQWSIR